MNKFSVCVGIPAYNEEANIGKLISTLLRQKQSNFNLTKILIVSDGSTDQTNRIVHNFNHQIIELIELEIRTGKFNAQNTICNKADTDALVLIDADVEITDDFFISKIVNPIIDNNKIGLVAGEVKTLTSNSFFENTLSSSEEFKTTMFEEINQGNNVFLCHGAARALSKSFYKSLSWPGDCSEDAYTYLMCLRNKFSFTYYPVAFVVVKSPSSISDHAKRSRRFDQGSENLKKYFDRSFVENEFKIPKGVFIKNLLMYIIIHPVYSVAYIITMIYIKLFYKLPGDISKWEISATTKKL